MSRSFVHIYMPDLTGEPADLSSQPAIDEALRQLSVILTGAAEKELGHLPRHAWPVSARYVVILDCNVGSEQLEEVTDRRVL